MKMKLSIPLAAALVLFPAAQLFAQTNGAQTNGNQMSGNQMSGTSHPDDLDDTVPTVPVDNTHYVPPSQQAPASTSTVVPQDAPVPYTPPGTLASSPTASSPTAPIATDSSTTTPALYRRTTPPIQTAAVGASDPTLHVTDDVDSGIVTDVPIGPNELPIGTRIDAILQQPISTATTLAGTRFTARLSADVSRNGVVFIPSGSLIYGRITHIHGGRRISGPSAIRLQPDSVSLPDGTTYPLDAEVTDLDNFASSHVNDEGTIVGSTNGKATAAILGATTGTAVIAGAAVGGGVGAIVGLGIGAGAGTIWWLKQDRQQELPTGTQIVFTLNEGLQVNPAAH